jgi:hypothetical protein
MARVSLQVKNIASLVLAAAASLSSAIAVRKFFEHGQWGAPAGCLALFLALQLCLIFIESKEEEELSLLRQHRLDRSRHAAEERARITLRIQREIDHGTVEVAEQWRRFRERDDR